MPALLPTENLEREHRYIEKVVKACLAVSEGLDSGQTVDADLLRRIVDFMRTYADRCHHGKEELLLFPALVRNGVPMTGCPIGALTAEHVQGRRLVGGLADSLALLENAEAEAGKGILESLRGINRLYPNHIWKEDYLVFPMTLKVLKGNDLADLQIKFEKVEQSIGAGILRGHEEFADGLEGRWKKSP